MGKEAPPKPPETSPFRPEKLNNGITAGIVSTCLTHPLDVLKLRMQISPRRCSAYQLASQIYRNEGLRAFYNGMTAGLLRQATYTATRLVMYDYLYDMYAREYKQKPRRGDRVAIAILAGLAGGFVGNPSEVVLVRRMAGGTPMAISSRCCCHSYYYVETYKGTLDALKTIKREEGLAALWRGTTLTLMRSVFLSVAHVGMYFKIRELLKKNDVTKERFTLTLISSIVTAFVCAVITHPIDMMKSLYQSSSDTGRLKSILDRIILCRGAKDLWKGFTPYFARMAIHTIATFMILEEFKRCAKERERKEAEEKKEREKKK